MNIDFEDTKSFLRKHNYLVNVNQLKDGCEVVFPTKIKQVQQGKYAYELIRSDPTGIKFSDLSNNHEELWGAPEYVLRLMVACDIARKMRKFPIHEGLIDYHTLEGNYTTALGNLLKSPINDLQRRKEEILSVIVTEAIKDNFKSTYEDLADSPEQDVGVGYRLLKGFF